MFRLCFLTRALTTGGSERQLLELVTRLDPREFDVTVLTFYPGGGLASGLPAHPSIKVVSLEKGGRWDLLGFAWRAWRQIRRDRPDLIHGYLGTANELALLLGRLTGVPVVWRLGAAWMDLSLYDWAWRVAFALGRRLSTGADCIIVNSEASRAHHRAEGWSVDRMVVIHNGFDTTTFRHDPEAGRTVRAAWGIGDDRLLVGLVARLDPIKDHGVFLEAAARVRRRLPGVHFVCVGDGAHDYAMSLQSHATRLGLDGALTWAGARHDMRAVYNACDVVTLCSRGESLPNAIGEAMACEVPCVATRVGDVEALVGDTGILVPSGDPTALAEGLEQLLRERADQRRERGRAARVRIETRFAIERCVGTTTDVLRGLLSRASPRRGAGREPL